MTAAMSMKVIRITTMVVKLVDQPQRQCANYFNRQRRKKIPHRHLVRHPRPQSERNTENQRYEKRRDDKVAKVQLSGAVNPHNFALFLRFRIMKSCCLCDNRVTTETELNLERLSGMDHV